ncbi:unnamed protein product [Rotaria socialis]|uniref:ABC1 atypical kinase-like domain-containing protein n=1 Tax=Rotaria socialis TaxID=392032 RepID=A0A817TH78_9BILA|nr:unnamed protein product [Rotaria socialis]CAF4197785.1 unnamed protein product [Rotaria socialis]
MSHRLSDAGRFLRGLTQLSQHIVKEATTPGDPRRRSPLTEPLAEFVSAGFEQLGNINIWNTISKTAWKSSVLIRQTGIAARNAIRSSPASITFVNRSLEDAVSIPSSVETNSSKATVTDTLIRDEIPVPNYPKIDSTNLLKLSTIEAKSESLIPMKTLDNATNRSIEKSTDSITHTVQIKATSTTNSTVDESKALLTLEENQNLILPPPINHEAQVRSVPTTRIGRLASFGSLAAGLGVGALGSMVRRSIGLEQESSSQNALSPYLSKANAERIVNTLCKVRGAALKLGQMISIQDNFLVQDDIQKIFERVRQKADFMPEWQMNEVMTNEFGSAWRDQFEEFQDRPFAAASIGQVHYGVLKHNRKRVAVKIQYPGVGKSIESDINNLVTLLNFWNILPKGLYIDNVVKVAKHELNWEVDYIREAEWGRRFQNWLLYYPTYCVPDVIDSLSTKNVLTTAFFDGITLDQAVNQDQETRDFIGRSVLEICLLELFKFKAMQTDPNWSNFLFNPSTKTIGLIDFGASRYFSPNFIDNYIKIIRASADNNPEGIKDLSVKCGFLTGYETREMTDAHVNAVMILGEGFRSEDIFDFGAQNTTKGIHKLIPVMLKHRLTPPPEDSYSLHRKMSGAFLLCSKLRSRVHCKPLFESVWKEYNSS